MSTVQQMVGSMTQGQEGAEEMNNVLGSMINNVTNPDHAMDPGADPLQSVMGMMGPMMANIAAAQGGQMMNKPSGVDAINEAVERQVAQARENNSLTDDLASETSKLEIKEVKD
jgi:hypothetical protein